MRSPFPVWACPENLKRPARVPPCVAGAGSARAALVLKREPLMLGILAIAVFIGVIIALNVFEFGRPD
ncbi:MAG: hypothetical protein ACXW3D_02545 [Caulobacteraceae bacterium]